MTTEPTAANVSGDSHVVADSAHGNKHEGQSAASTRRFVYIAAEREWLGILDDGDLEQQVRDLMRERGFTSVSVDVFDPYASDDSDSLDAMASSLRAASEALDRDQGALRSKIEVERESMRRLLAHNSGASLSRENRLSTTQEATMDEELRHVLDATSREQLEAAFIDAVRAFAQYAEGVNDPGDEAVTGFAIGFLQEARRG